MNTFLYSLLMSNHGKCFSCSYFFVKLKKKITAAVAILTDSIVFQHHYKARGFLLPHTCTRTCYCCLLDTLWKSADICDTSQAEAVTK